MPALSRPDRDAFLAAVHVAVLTVDEPGRGPLGLPIWYEYIDGGIELGMGSRSRKAELLRQAGRATVVVQDEAPPYTYVSVEGPVAEMSKVRDVRRVAIRYLGPDLGASYAEANPASADTAMFRLTPEHWRTQRFG